MRIKVTSVMVDDQTKAREVYVDKLGFVIKYDEPMGEFNWLTVTSPDGPDDVELLLEPTNFPPAKVFQNELKKAGIPAASFNVDDVNVEVDRLRSIGFEILSEPAKMGSATVASFDDTCGNIIHIYEI
jgi:catechol 2,3-dioxygenase-like lactoylglutathione lyase family enzyme